MKHFLPILILLQACSHTDFAQQYKVVGTGIVDCFDNQAVITCPTSAAQPFYGQFHGVFSPSYTNNGDGTVSDHVTGLMWQRDPDANGNHDGVMTAADKLTWPQIQAKITELNNTAYAGHSDWRIPTIKELYSLTSWTGTDPSVGSSTTNGLIPFLDQSVFAFAWGDMASGERIIDSQYASGTIYPELTASGDTKLFGFNFADGRIKGYDLTMPGGKEKTFSFIAVRGNENYGKNQWVDHGDNTITDEATGLMWAKNDSQLAMNWEDALAYAQTQNNNHYLGYSDWRLPDAKELQSIVDYSRSPGSSNSAAIDPVFNISSLTNEAGVADYPWFWSSTTHRAYNGSAYMAERGVYVCFGRATGWMKLGSNSYYTLVDIHGAGAQRSDPKSGTFVGNYLGVDINGKAVYGLGPQGDVLRVLNYVRLVRNATSTYGTKDHDQAVPASISPNPSVGSIRLHHVSANSEIEIFGADGRKCQYELTGQGSEREALVSAAGLYLIKIHSGTHTQLLKAIVQGK